MSLSNLQVGAVEDDWSTGDQRVFPIDSSVKKKWLERSKKEINFDGGSLIEGPHYHVPIVNNSLGELIGKIKSSCGTAIALVKNLEKFRLSNFSRHMVQKLRASSTPSPSDTLTTDSQENLSLCASDVFQSPGVLAPHSSVLAFSLSATASFELQALSSAPLDELTQ